MCSRADLLTMTKDRNLRFCISCYYPLPPLPSLSLLLSLSCLSLSFSQSHFLYLLLSLLHTTGAVSPVRLHPGREDHHGGGRQSDHHGAGGPDGDGSVHGPAAQSREQQSHPGHHHQPGASAEPKAGQRTNPAHKTSTEEHGVARSNRSETKVHTPLLVFIFLSTQRDF